MLIHHYDPTSKIYVSSEELGAPVANSTASELPELTDSYTVAFIDGVWVSVLRPDREIVDNQIVLIEG